MTAMLPDTNVSVTGRQRFLSPREVFAGVGALNELGSLLDQWASPEGQAFLVCDAAVSLLGFADALRSTLVSHGWRVTIFDGVTGEPTKDVLDGAVAAVRRSRHSVVVGLGGGSAMDVAKIAAALATDERDVEAIVGVSKLVSAPLPLILVPTTAGTGSEATRIAMVSLDGRKQVVNDARLIPTIAVLDATLVRSTPRTVTAATGMDALSHAIEGALSLDASPLSFHAAGEAISLVSRWLPAAYGDGGDLAARQGTMYAAYLGGLALNAGSILGHSIGYTIANRTGLPHGATVALALPFCIAYCADASGDRINEIWRRASEHGLGASDIYEWLESLLATFGMASSLRELSLTEQDAVEMARECVDKYPRANCPVPLEIERITELYQHIFAGDIDACLTAFGVARTSGQTIQSINYEKRP